MNHLPPSTPDDVESELARLYEKRRVVDELIRSLERYATFESRRFAEVLTDITAQPAAPARGEL